jgi:tRNA(fMet)-specific endonuclease VapC
MAPVAGSWHAQIKGQRKVIYILDTEVFTLAELSDTPAYLHLRDRVLQLENDDRLVTTIITYEEQTRGWLAYAAKSRDVRHQIKAYSRLRKHLQTYLGFEILDFDAAAGEAFERLRRAKLSVGTLDLKIAAIALSQDAVLISRNLKDFRGIPGLRVEDWTKN